MPGVTRTVSGCEMVLIEEEETMEGLDSVRVDKVSYQLGMITAFVEVVAAGVKKLGLSPPLDPETFDQVMAGAQRLAEAHDVSLHVEKDFLTTDLFDPEFTRGKYVLLIYADPEILDIYLGLKAQKMKLLESGGFEGNPRRQIAVELGRLLSYREDRVEKMLASAPKSLFMLESS